MAERAVGDIGDAQFLGRVNEAISLVQGLKSGVFCLDGIDLCDFKMSMLATWNDAIHWIALCTYSNLLSSK